MSKKIKIFLILLLISGMTTTGIADSSTSNKSVDISKSIQSSANSEQDYTCVDSVAAKSPPQTLKVDNDINKIPLCSNGQVPEAVNSDVIQYATMYNKEPSDPKTASCSSGICYDWAVSNQHISNKGIFALISQHNPEIDPVNGIYSLAGVVVIGGKNRVEFGWRKAKGNVPRLVTTWWKNGVKKCDNAGCGWVQFSNKYYPGMSISTDGSTKLYEIEYNNGDWWIYWNGEYLGYYPGVLWNGQFVQGTDIVYRGGVVSKVPVTTTDMGNGLWASNPNAAIIDEQEYLDINTGWSIANTNKWATSPNLYSVVAVNNKIMRYGGPGGTASILVASPNGGENWKKGSTKIIKWSYTGNIGTKVKIELLKGGKLNKVITSNAPNSGSYKWIIPSVPVSGDYKIRITSVSNSKYNDMSNNNFKIY